MADVVESHQYLPNPDMTLHRDIPSQSITCVLEESWLCIVLRRGSRMSIGRKFPAEFRGYRLRSIRGRSNAAVSRCEGKPIGLHGKRTCLIATISPVALSIALYTVPKLPPVQIPSCQPLRAPLTATKARRKLTSQLLQHLILTRHVCHGSRDAG